MLQLRIESIRREAPDTATFFLHQVDGKRIDYQAGQFITLIVNHHNEELRRSYSLSSSPDDDLLALTIKRVPNGELSRFLLMYAQPGDIWLADGPSGKFVLAEMDQDLIFFAAGSGITPIFSQLKYLLNRQGRSKLTLIYSNQNRKSILFKAELDALQEQHPDRFTIVHLLSDEAERLNNVRVEKLVNQYAGTNIPNTAFYLCGPFSYMRMVRMTLLFMGIEPAQIRKENFVLETVPVATNHEIFAPHRVQIEFNHETYNIKAGENQTILQAALQNNIPLPYSCRTGICSACSARCTDGNVHMVNNEVLTDADLATGWVLTCTGYAMDDEVVIKFL